MNTTLLLFDIDGTLLLTGGAGIRAMHAAMNEVVGRELKWNGVQTAGKLDPVIFAEVAATNGIDDVSPIHDQFRDTYISMLGKELQRCKADIEIMPGIMQLIDSLRQRQRTSGDVTLGLLTGNYTAAVPVKLNTIGLDKQWFPVTAFGDEAATRPQLGPVALDKYETHTGTPADPARVIVIGDTPNDVNCAAANNFVAFAVATGRFETADLDAAGADVVVEDLSDPQPLIDLIDR